MGSPTLLLSTGNNFLFLEIFYHDVKSTDRRKRISLFKGIPLQFFAKMLQQRSRGENLGSNRKFFREQILGLSLLQVFLRWILTTPLSCLLESPRLKSMSPRAKKQSKKLIFFLELPWNFIDFNDFSILNLHFTI